MKSYPHLIRIDALDVMRDITLDVTVSVRNIWRLEFGAALLQLAAWVLRCTITIDERPRDAR